MRIRDSGMPEQELWETFFDTSLILNSFKMDRFSDVIEIGCGYGTFSVPIAQSIRGPLYAYDIDSKMVEATIARTTSLNVRCEVRDVFDGLDQKADAVLLFNNLHCEEPASLLRIAKAALRPRGEILVIHWRSDIPTPRGPSKAIRPTPQAIKKWAGEVDLEVMQEFVFPEWHYGLILKPLLPTKHNDVG